MSDRIQLVCFLDVLGFESRLKSHGLDQIMEKYELLIEYVKSQNGGLDVIQLPDGHVAVGWLELGNAYFSDTILFWCKFNELSVASFSRLIGDAICFGLEIGLPLRGAISVGEAVMDADKGIFIGDALVEAARTEVAQRWIGASYGPSLSNPDLKVGFHLDTVMPFKSHYKDVESKFATGMTVDWPRFWREKRGDTLAPIVEAMNTVPEASDYYKNTLSFIEYSEQNHDWFKKRGNLGFG